MGKIVKLKESELNKIIQKVLKEQEDQYISDVDQETINSDNFGGDEPDFTELLDCARTLFSQGVTIGQIVDKLCDIKGNDPEVE